MIVTRDFPEGFLWGTSTSALQIETAQPHPFDHDWRGLPTRDGSEYDRNIEHDFRREEDADIISLIGNAYRLSFDWAKLQKGPYRSLESATVDEYREFLGTLKDKGMHIMLVLHHFASPMWFIEGGSWFNKESSMAFANYATKMQNAFGDLVDSWNTLNEPTLLPINGYITGYFPPQRKGDFIAAIRLLNGLQRGHQTAYRRMKVEDPDSIIGVSNNTMAFNGTNLAYQPFARLYDWYLVEHGPNRFNEVDFVGLSYYGRMPSSPRPFTVTEKPAWFDKHDIPHDDLFETYPEGLPGILDRVSHRHQKPIIITENGTCSKDDQLRIHNMRDHLEMIYQAIKRGIDIRGYFHWSTFDNTELHEGPDLQFGLVNVNPDTLDRTPKPSARVYAEIARNNSLEYTIQ